MLEGLWRLEDGRIRTELFRDADPPGEVELDDEIARVEELLDRKK